MAELKLALRYDGRRRVHRADDAMAGTTAQHLIEHLEWSDFVLMKRPPARAPSVPGGGRWEAMDALERVKQLRHGARPRAAAVIPHKSR